MKTELLVQMDGCSPSASQCQLLLVGATNRPEVRPADEKATRLITILRDVCWSESTSKVMPATASCHICWSHLNMRWRAQRGVCGGCMGQPAGRQARPRA